MLLVKDGTGLSGCSSGQEARAAHLEGDKHRDQTNNDNQTGLCGSGQETQSDVEWVGELLQSWIGQQSLSGDRSTCPQTAALVAVS